MRLAALFLALAASLAAQLTPSSLSFSQRSYGAPPYYQAIVVTGSGAVTVNSCSNVSGTLCTYLQTNATQSVGTVYAYLDGFESFFMPTAATTSATLSITRAGGTCSTSCTETVTFITRALTAPLFPTSEAACSNTNIRFLGNDTCPIANVRPGGTFTQPTLGNTTTDGTFGGVYRRVANDPYGSIGADSITSAPNKDGSLVQVVSQNGGAVTLNNTTTGASTYTVTGVNSMSWDPTNANVYYYFHTSTPTVHKVTLPGLVDTVVATYTPVGTANNLRNGGDGDVSNDLWWCGHTEGGTDRYMVVANLNTGAVYSYDYSGIVTMSNPPRSCTISPLDATSGVHFIALGSNPNNAGLGGGANSFFTITNAGTITNLGPEPLTPMAASDSALFKTIPTTLADCVTGKCRAAEHGNTFVQAPNGEVYWGVLYGVQVVGYVSWDFVRMNTVLANMASIEIDVESGGARTYTMPMNLNTGSIHGGCATAAPVCAIGHDVPQTTAYTITNVATGGTTTVTTSPNYPGANGDILLINGVLGVTGMSGPTLCTVSGLSGATFICLALSTSGTYTASTGSFVLNATPAASPYQTDLIIFDLTRIALGSGGISAKRLLATRSYPYGGDRIGSNYYGQPHPGMSADGTKVCWESNNGIPDNVGVFCADTGYVAVANAGARPIVSGKAAVSRVPLQ